MMNSTVSDRFVLKRNFSIDLGSLLVGQYIKVNSKVILADFKCNCGHVITITSNHHTIDENGVVMPSVGHDQCGFHEWVKLDKWSKNNNNS